MAALHAAALPPGWTADAIAGLLAQPGVAALIAHDNSGFVMVRSAADEAEILAIAVSGAARRGGVGRALLQAAMADAWARGAVRLHLEVAADNDGARAFYADAGFIQSGRRPRYYPNGADALLLSRTVTQETVA